MYLRIISRDMKVYNNYSMLYILFSPNKVPSIFQDKQEQNVPHLPDLWLALQLFSNPKMEDSIKQLIKLFN